VHVLAASLGSAVEAETCRRKMTLLAEKRNRNPYLAGESRCVLDSDQLFLEWEE